jgi:hypothetical protein
VRYLLECLTVGLRKTTVSLPNDKLWPVWIPRRAYGKRRSASRIGESLEKGGAARVLNPGGATRATTNGEESTIVG